QASRLVSNNCPINVYRQRWTSSRGSPHIHALWRQLQAHLIHRVGNDLRYGEVAPKISTPVLSAPVFPELRKAFSSASTSPAAGRRLPCTNKRQLKWSERRTGAPPELCWLLAGQSRQ